MINKFIVSSGALLKALLPLSGTIGNNPVVPILDNFLFEAEAGQLTAMASDLEVTISTVLPIEGNGAFSLCVPARKLLDTLKNLPDQPLTFAYDGAEQRLRLASVNGNYKLATEAATDYPKPQAKANGSPLNLPASVLKTAIERTVFAISTDELRPAMTGVLLQLEATQLTFVATDGHRLLRYRRTDLGSGRTCNVLIPRKAWALLNSTLPKTEGGMVNCWFSQSFGTFTYGALTLHARLIDERYPDYENVIPVSNPNTLTINRAELLGAVRRMHLYANRTTHQVSLRLSGSEVVVSAQDLDSSNEARETLACQYDGEDFEIGFNARFLDQMLANLSSEQVSLALSTPNRAGLLSPVEQGDGEDVLMLVMPVMLTNYV